MQNRYGPQPWETVEIDEEPFAPPVFGGYLVDMMEWQKSEQTAASSMAIPEAVFVLAKHINDLGGHTAEGIFRIPGELLLGDPEGR